MEICKAIETALPFWVCEFERERGLGSSYNYTNLKQFDRLLGSSVSPTLEGGEKGVVGMGGWD